ncbi:hypothetical protein [Streptomyces sp. NBC_00233]|uniref:hypothetical protein n=1 Tax=Streptomyces sp. NBC_00233 TaxID=2975686 RepID=UPI002259BBC1|nr:hypothetical protein [Streptomyces sp. NBC_00233]MCX5226675.1 hypothetical protein [Streptomyces sp. NBC_00233]
MTASGVPTAGRVTKEWAAEFPGFDVWRSLRLLRRIGPVVQGICLDRTTGGDGYVPTAHVHALTREFPVVSLMLGQRAARPSGTPDPVLFARHERDFAHAVGALREQSRLPLDEPPSIDAIVREYHAEARRRLEKGHGAAVPEMEDSVLVAAAAGRDELAGEGLVLARELTAAWPKWSMPLEWPGAEAWLDGLAARAGDRESLRAVVRGQATAHRLGKVRDHLFPDDTRNHMSAP